MNATELMDEQQHAIEDLLRAVDRTEPGDAARLHDLAARLASHMRIEEEILFPLARTTSARCEQTLSALVLRRMTEDGPSADHAKLAKVVELAAAHLDLAHDAVHDVLRDAIDHDTVEDIGESLATIFEDGVRVARDRAARTRRRRASARRPARDAARRR